MAGSFSPLYNNKFLVIRRVRVLLKPYSRADKSQNHYIKIFYGHLHFLSHTQLLMFFSSIPSEMIPKKYKMLCTANIAFLYYKWTAYSILISAINRIAIWRRNITIIKPAMPYLKPPSFSRFNKSRAE